MLTAEQEKTLLELGFKEENNHWIKKYSKYAYISIYNPHVSECYLIWNYGDNMIEEAQHDLAILREKGIV